MENIQGVTDNIKTYTCEMCEKVFYRKDSYKRHFKRKTPCVNQINNFPCPNCKKKFSRSTVLAHHMKTVCLKDNQTKYFGNNLKLYLEYIDPPDFEKQSTDITITAANIQSIMINVSRYVKRIFFSKYIENIPYDRRSIWGLDKSRDRYLIRYNGKWRVDSEQVIVTELFWKPMMRVIKRICNIIGKRSKERMSGRKNDIIDEYEKYMDKEKITNIQSTYKITKTLTQIYKETFIRNVLRSLFQHLTYKDHEFSIDI